MIRWAVLLLPFCILITANQENDEIPWAIADMAMDIHDNPLDYNIETETDKIDEDMFDMLLASHPFHSQDRREMQYKIRNSKKIRKQRRVKPHTLPTL